MEVKDRRSPGASGGDNQDEGLFELFKPTDGIGSTAKPFHWAVGQGALHKRNFPQQPSVPESNVRQNLNSRFELGSFHEPAYRFENDLRGLFEEAKTTLPKKRVPDSTPDQFDSRVQGGFRISKWPMRFSGAPGELLVEEFLFRIERLARLDGVSEAALVIGIGVLLTGRAAQWYWTYQRNAEHSTWTQFKQAFIRRYKPKRETDHDIRAQIENRKQRQGEQFGDYCQDVEAIEVRLTQRMSTKELVESLRRNMIMPLRKALFRTVTETVDELLLACSEFEELCEEEDRMARAAHRKAFAGHRQVNEIDEYEQEGSWDQSQFGGTNNRSQVEAIQQISRTDNIICWNCKDIGHPFTQCGKPQQGRFCFTCGLAGVIKAECPKCAGNVRRDGGAAMATRPSHSQTNPSHILKRNTVQSINNNNPFSK